MAQNGTKGPSNGEWLMLFSRLQTPSSSNFWKPSSALIYLLLIITGSKGVFGWSIIDAINRGKCTIAACLALCVLQHGGLNHMRQARASDASLQLTQSR